MLFTIIILIFAGVVLVTTIIKQLLGKERDDDTSYDPHSGGER